MRTTRSTGAGPAADAPVYSITTTPASVADDQRQPRNRYLISMAVRTLCFVLAVVVTGPLRWVFLAGAVLLPYVAVVLANAGTRRRPDGFETPGTVAAPALEDRSAGVRVLGEDDQRG